MLLALTGYELALLLAAAVFIVFALVVAMVVPRSRPDFPANRLGVFVGICVALFLVQMGAVLALAEIGEAEHSEAVEPPAETETEPPVTTPTETETETGTETETETETGGSTALGRELFVANCASCHTLADAGTSGTIGPNLDESAPSLELVVDRVTNGQGVMPSFASSLSEEEIQEVAAYVTAATG